MARQASVPGGYRVLGPAEGAPFDSERSVRARANVRVQVEPPLTRELSTRSSLGSHDVAEHAVELLCPFVVSQRTRVAPTIEASG